MKKDNQQDLYIFCIAFTNIKYFLFDFLNYFLSRYHNNSEGLTPMHHRSITTLFLETEINLIRYLSKSKENTKWN